MKVLHVFNTINHSGAEVMYAQAGPMFSDAGVKLVAMSTGRELGTYKDQMMSAGYDVAHLPEGGSRWLAGFDPRFFVRFFQYLRRENFDLVHIHRNKHYLLISLCCWLAGVKTIRTLHNVFKNKSVLWIKGYLERVVAKKLLGVVFHSIGETVEEHELVCYRNETHRINNWFDERRFYPAIDSCEKKKLREELGLPQEKFVLLSVGRCTEIKNHIDILVALSQLKNEINICFVHVGEGACLESEIRFAEEYGLVSNNMVKFVGLTDRVRDYLVASDIFVMPSKFEGLSIAALEAMGCGIPTILYDVSGLKDIIKSEAHGKLIPASHVFLAKAIREYWADSGYRKSVSIQAREKVLNDFGVYGAVQSMVELYHGLTSGEIID